MSSSQPEDYLLVSLKLMDFISVSLCAQPSLPPRSEVAVDDGLCLSVVHWVTELFHLPLNAKSHLTMPEAVLIEHASSALA